MQAAFIASVAFFLPDDGAAQPRRAGNPPEKAVARVHERIHDRRRLHRPAVSPDLPALKPVD